MVPNKKSVLIGFSTTNHPVWRSPVYGHPIYIYTYIHFICTHSTYIDAHIHIFQSSLNIYTVNETCPMPTLNHRRDRKNVKENTRIAGAKPDPVLGLPARGRKQQCESLADPREDEGQGRCFSTTSRGDRTLESWRISGKSSSWCGLKKILNSAL